jgi:hypothetical protein
MIFRMFWGNVAKDGDVAAFLFQRQLQMLRVVDLSQRKAHVSRIYTLSSNRMKSTNMTAHMRAYY